MTKYRDRCAIVIPIYQTRLTDYERISFSRTVQMFSNRDIYIASPSRLRGSINIDGENDWLTTENVSFMWFDDLYFSSLRSYNRLMLDAAFYQAFSRYDYILIAQIDTFTFEDRLDEFLDKGLDYIGAPWFDGFATAATQSQILPYCGNGGYSLRKVESFIRILAHQNAKVEPLSFYLMKIKTSSFGKWPSLIANCIIDCAFHNSIKSYWRSLFHYEDYFWAKCARRIDGKFTSASPEISSAFAFECNPEVLFAKNGERLPMGCHAWWKYGLEFWMPHIEKCGFKLS